MKVIENFVHNNIIYKIGMDFSESPIDELLPFLEGKTISAVNDESEDLLNNVADLPVNDEDLSANRHGLSADRHDENINSEEMTINVEELKNKLRKNKSKNKK
ncbi:MAG: hypothetical protein WAR79_11815 [Melioribacteraceae bacterium]